MSTIIGPEDSLALLAVVLSCVAFGCWLETRRHLGQFGLLSIYLLAALLSTIGVIPKSSELYTVISSYFVPLSLSLLLFKADILSIWRHSGRMLVAFLIATTGVVLGAILGVRLLDLGSSETEIAGIVVAGWVGGSVNVGAVADSFNLATSEILTATVASLFVIGIPFLALLTALPGMGPVWRLFALQQPESQSVEKDFGTGETPAEITSMSMILSLAVASVIVWLSTVASDFTGYAPVKYALITTLSVLLATFFPAQTRKLSGHYEIGKVLIYGYFAVIGASIDFALAFEYGSDIVMFAFVVIACHLVLLVAVGRGLKLSGPEMVIGSSACIVGPATAAAIATAYRWDDLVTPGILVGILGYVMGTFLGIGFAAFL